MKHLHTLLAAIMATTTASAQEPLPDGTYYIQNATTGTFISSGATWGTRSVLSPHGVDIAVKQVSGGYTLTTRIAGNDKGMRPSDAYMDQSGTWTVQPLDDGTYAMFNGTNYLCYDATYARPWLPRLSATDTESTDTHWRFLSYDDMKAKLSEATRSNPVDATFLIKAPDFLLYDQRVIANKVWGSDLTAIGGNKESNSYLRNNANAEQYNKPSFDIYQQLTDMPNGIYTLSVQGFYRYGSTSVAATARKGGTEQLLPVLYAGNKSVPLQSIFEHTQATSGGAYTHTSSLGYVVDTQSDAAILFDEGHYVNTITDIVVTDGTLRIGIRKANQTVASDWTCFDCFTLLYHGQDLSAVRQVAIDAVEEYAALNTTGDDLYAADLAALMARAEALESEEELASIRQDLHRAYSYYLSRPTPDATPINLCALLVNPGFSQGTYGWTEQYSNVGTATTAGFTCDRTLSPVITEVYAGYSDQEIDSYSLTQDVTLSPGMYRLSTHAFFRYGSTYNIDLSADNTPRSQAYMFAGEEYMPIMRLGDIALGSYPDKMSDAAAAFAEGKYSQRLIFTITQPTTLTLGFWGTFDRNRSWFCFSPVELEKISDKVLEAEAIAAFAERRQEVINSWKKWEAIVKQATDRSSYDEALAQATAAAETAYNDEQIQAIDKELRQALYNLMATQPTATGQYDITTLLQNPSFNINTDGWISTHSIAWMEGGLAELYNITDNEFSQTLTDMPAGCYTLKVQAFCRPRGINGSTAAYESGEGGVTAELFMGNDSQPLLNIHDGARHLSARPGSDLYGAYGKSVPNSISGAADAFAQGNYWNILRSQRTTAGDLVIGMRHHEAQASNWVAFDNFRLYYGAPKQQLTLSRADKFTLTEDTYADVSTDIELKAGCMNSICLPFDMPASHFKAAYTLAGFDYDATQKTATAMLMPVCKLKAGEGYFVTVDNDCTLSATDVLVRALLPDSIPSIWSHTAMQGIVGKTSLRRSFTLNDDGQLEYKAIRSNNPGMQAVVYADVPATVKLVPLKVIDYSDVHFDISIENEQVAKFLAAAKYSTGSASIVANYTQGACRLDQPKTAIVPLPASTEELTITYGCLADLSDGEQQTAPAGSETAELRNLYPSRTYFYNVCDSHGEVSRGQFTTTGTLRMLKANTGSNMRDLGGWLTTGGNRLNYGLVYRGGEMNAGHVMSEADRAELRRVGIASELDLRCDDQVPGIDMTVSPLGDDVPFLYINQDLFNEDALQTKHWYYDSFLFIIDNLREGRPLYFHCIWGADRTGAMAFVLEGLCGVTADQLYKDYELTSFSIAGMREKTGIDSKLTYIRTSFKGATLQEKFIRYWNEYVGIDIDDLYDFISLMGGDTDIITGIATSQASTPDAPVFYGTDGIKRSTIRNGINIIRHSDGSVEKILK